MTAWELHSEGISCTYITDNAGGHLMQHGQVDMVIVGTDRTTARGDVCNKIGITSALCAHDNNLPFYVSSSPTIDGGSVTECRIFPLKNVPNMRSLYQDRPQRVRSQRYRSHPAGCRGNPAFDVTLNHLVTGLITEAFPKHRKRLCKDVPRLGKGAEQ